MLSLYSLIWTFLISCPMLLLIFILRRRSDYLTKYGVTFISILYIFCTVRMLFPIEFPSHQKVICDPYLYSFLMNLYAKSEDIHKKIVMAVILTIWIIGIIIAVVHKMREWNKVKGYLIKGTSEGDGVAEKILREIDSECPIKIEYNLALQNHLLRDCDIQLYIFHRRNVTRKNWNLFSCMNIFIGREKICGRSL